MFGRTGFKGERKTKKKTTNSYKAYKIVLNHYRQRPEVSWHIRKEKEEIMCSIKSSLIVVLN